MKKRENRNRALLLYGAKLMDYYLDGVKGGIRGLFMIKTTSSYRRLGGGMKINMKLKQLFVSSCLGITSFLLVSCVPVWSDDNPAVSIDYYRVNYYAENENYWGDIEGVESSKVRISDKKTGKDRFISVDFLPSQITFGKMNFYLLECGDNKTTTEARIYCYDYRGNFVGSREVDGCNYISADDGKIFLQYWLDEDQSSADTLHNGIIANCWIDEKDFHGEIVKMELDENDECRVGELCFYKNSKGYFSTEREYGGYPALGSYTVDQVEQGYVTEQMERKIENLKRQAEIEKDQLYYTCFYQSGSELYGIFNVWEEAGYNAYNKFQIPVNKCVKSYAYRINMETEKMEIEHELRERCVGLIATKDGVIYCEKDGIKKVSLSTGGITVLFDGEGEKEFDLETTDLILQSPYLLIRIYSEKEMDFRDLYIKY